MLNLSRSLMMNLTTIHSPGVRHGILRCLDIISCTASFTSSRRLKHSNVEFHRVETSATRVRPVCLISSSVATLDFRKVLTMSRAFFKMGISASSFSKARTAVWRRWILQLWRFILQQNKISKACVFYHTLVAKLRYVPQPGR